MVTNNDQTFAAMIADFHEQPFSKRRRDILADWCEEYSDDVRRLWAPILRDGRWPLTKLEFQAVQTLGNCNFAPATWDKRFAADVCAVVSDKSDLHQRFGHPSLTIKQMLWTWILLRRYRRSVRNPAFVDEAEKRYNHCVKLLDVGHLKPLTITKKNGMAKQMQLTLFDEEP